MIRQVTQYKLVIKQQI